MPLASDLTVLFCARYFPKGLINRAKKILECVCFECGKLKVDASNPLFARTRLLKDPKRRFKEVWNLAKGVMVCEGGDEEDEDVPEGGVKKHPHGGCGARQPKIRRDGLKLLAVTQKSDEVSLLQGDFALGFGRAVRLIRPFFDPH